MKYKHDIIFPRLIGYKVAIFLLCFFCVMGANLKFTSITVNASSKSWISGADQSIYGGDTKEPEETETEAEKPGTIEKLFIGLIKPIVDGLYDILQKLNIDMNSVVFGRVGGHGYTASTGNKISLFTFELSRGNPYGMVALSIYNTIRGIAIIIMAVVLFARFVSTTYSSNSGKAKDAFKDALKYSLLAFLFLTVMPYFLDVMIYVRDSILYAVGIRGASNLLGIGTESTVVDAFKDGASKSLLNTFMYAGSIVLSIYFAVQYAGVALSMCISVVAFPFVCIKSQTDKTAISSWVNEVIGYLLIPIFDSILLLIPASMSLLSSNGADRNAIAVVQLFVCAMLIPARQTLRTILGFRSQMGLEGASIGTMMAGAMLAKSAIGNTAGAIGKGIKDYKEGSSDIEMGNMTSELSQLEQGSSGYSMSDASYSGNQINDYQSEPAATMQGDWTSNNENNMDMSPGNIDTQRQAILHKYANASNFENPAFKGLSSQRRAELYKERGKRKRAEAVSEASGNVLGSTVGGVVGASFGTMMGGKAMMFGASAGINTGGRVGAAAVKGITNAGVSINDYLNKLAADDNNMHIEDSNINMENSNMPLGVSADSTNYNPAVINEVAESNFAYSNTAMAKTSSENHVYDQFANEEAEYYNFLNRNNEAIRGAVMNAMDFNSSPEKTAQIEKVYEMVKNDNSIPSTSKKEAFGKQVEDIMMSNYVKDIKNSAKFKKSGNFEKDDALIKKSVKEGFLKHCYYEPAPDTYTPTSAITNERLEKFGWTL